MDPISDKLREWNVMGHPENAPLIQNITILIEDKSLNLPVLREIAANFADIIKIKSNGKTT